MTTHGFARTLSRSLGNCELLHIPRQPIDLNKASLQHAAYVAALTSAEVQITVLPEEPDLPDATFVEDPVIILDEVTVICRLGSRSRESEAARISKEVEKIRPVHRIIAPGTLEGGDVLRIGKTLFVGASNRTNNDGIRQLQQIVSRFGYRVVAISISKCLHLKTGATSPAERMIVVNAEWIDTRAFHGFDIIKVPESEPLGANTLAVNGTVFVNDNASRTAELLEAKGLRVQRIDISELQKAEAGLTCLSILFSENRAPV